MHAASPWDKSATPVAELAFLHFGWSQRQITPRLWSHAGLTCITRTSHHVLKRAQGASPPVGVRRGVLPSRRKLLPLFLPRAIEVARKSPGSLPRVSSREAWLPDKDEMLHRMLPSMPPKAWLPMCLSQEAGVALARSSHARRTAARRMVGNMGIVEWSTGCDDASLVQLHPSSGHAW